MVSDRVVVIYADTWEGLTVKMIGYNHDHCWHYYAGLTADVPKKLLEFVVEDKKYVFLCEEDIPYKPDENERD